MDISTIMENVSSLDLKEHIMKKSILVAKSPGDEFTGSFRRGTSKAQIQWKEVPTKAEEERKIIKTSLPVLGLLASRDYRWNYIHDPMRNLSWEELKHVKQTSEDVQAARIKAVNCLIQDFGVGALQKRQNKNPELTLDQQTNLEILKHNIKAENDAYLRMHPEINIMIRKVYAALFKNRPVHPKKFVSDYVHYLNKHREELVVEEVDVPFDRPVIPEEVTSEEKERHQVREFARKLVESCLNLATLGQSFVDVMSIMNSMLKAVSPSEDEISVESSIESAEAAVSEVLTSLLTSVAINRSTSAELVVDKVLSLIMSIALPFVNRESQVCSEMRNSIESFISDLVDQLTDNVMNHITIKEIMDDKEPTNENKGSQEEKPTMSILKRNVSLDDDYSGRHETKNKVKFQSFS